MTLPVRHMLLLIPQKDSSRIGLRQAGCSLVSSPALITAELAE